MQHLTKAAGRWPVSWGLDIAREGHACSQGARGVGTWKPEGSSLPLYGLAAWCVYDTEVRDNDAAAILERVARTIRKTLEQSSGSLTDQDHPYIEPHSKLPKPSRTVATPVMHWSCWTH